MTFTRQLLALCASALFAAASYACDSGEADCVEVGKWDISLGIGAGVRTNPVEDGDDIPLVLIPQVNYNGERFFIQNLDLGVILWENDSQQFNLVMTPSYDQVFFDRWNPSNFFNDSNALVSTGVDKNGNEGFGPENPPIEGGTELVNPGFKDVGTRALRNRRTAGLAGIEYQPDEISASPLINDNKVITVFVGGVYHF